MEHITFTCRVITPIFLAGADGSTPELRAPSIKGAMRFWWRALNGHLDVEKLRQREGEIFGDTNNGRSKVIIRVLGSMTWDGFTYPPTPHKPNFRRQAFEPNAGDFTLKLSQKSTLTFEDGDTFSIDDLAKLFLLTTTLGGFGGRARRGFGAIDIVSQEGNFNFTMPKTIDEILSLLPMQYFYKVKDKILSKFNIHEDYPYVKCIEIGNSVEYHDKLLQKIGASSSLSKSENHDSWPYRNSLGHVSSRFSSPVFVSILSKNEQFFPIISTLNIALEKGKSIPSEHKQIQDTFKNRIL